MKNKKSIIVLVSILAFTAVCTVFVVRYSNQPMAADSLSTSLTSALYQSKTDTKKTVQTEKSSSSSASSSKTSAANSTEKSTEKSTTTTSTSTSAAEKKTTASTAKNTTTTTKKTTTTTKKPVATTKKVTTTKKTTTTTKKVTTTKKTTTAARNTDTSGGLPILNSNVYIQNFGTLLNNLRTSNGCSKLSNNSRMNRLAGVRAKEISKSFSHTRPDGRKSSTVYTDYGVPIPKLASENIACAKQATEPGDMFQIWVESSDHLKNMLYPNFTKFGIAAYTENGVTYAVLMFA